jgi:hypothetical protein
MALITSILPDVDGDLHTADLHNTKFNTILNEINGNLDQDNLKYPKSFMTLSCRAGVSYDIADGATAAANRNPYGYITLTGVTSSGVADAPGAFRVANDSPHALTNSFHQVPSGSSYTIQDVNVVTIKRATTWFVSGEDFTLTLQKCATLTGTWSTLWEVDDEDFHNAGGNIFAEVGASEAPSVYTVASTNWIRFVIKNPSSWGATTKLAPELMVNVVVKVSHIA